MRNLARLLGFVLLAGMAWSQNINSPSNSTFNSASITNSSGTPVVVSLSKYGAICDGSHASADTTALTNALAALPLRSTSISGIGGGVILIPQGNCQINSTITIPPQALGNSGQQSGGVTIQGVGNAASTISYTSASGSLFSADAGSAGASNFTIQDVFIITTSSYTGDLVYTNNVQAVRLLNVNWYNVNPSVVPVNVHIKADGTCGSCGSFVFNHLIKDNLSVGVSVVFDSVDDAQVIGGQWYPTVNLATATGRPFAFEVLSSPNIQFIGVHTQAPNVGCPVSWPSGKGTCISGSPGAAIYATGSSYGGALRVQDGTFDGPTFSSSTSDYIYSDLSSNNGNGFQIQGNIMGTGAGSAVEFLNSAQQATISGNTFTNVGTGVANAGGIPTIKFDAGNNGAEIHENHFINNVNLGTKDVVIYEGSNSNGDYSHNHVVGIGASLGYVANGQIFTLPGGTSSMLGPWSADGYVSLLASSGSQVISSGATSVTFNHNLPYAPSVNAITITPIAQAGTTGWGSVRQFLVCNITATQIQVCVDQVPGGAGFGFVWKATYKEDNNY